MLQESSYQQIRLDASGQAIKDSNGNPTVELKKITEQIIPMGPVSSQVAIKQLGTNGGGFLIVTQLIPLKIQIH